MSFTTLLINKLVDKGKQTDAFAEALYRIASEMPEDPTLQELVFKKVLLDIEILNALNKAV